MVVTALTLGACVRSIARPTGVVTGIVDACQGLALPTGESLPVKVSFYSGSGLVASETVRSGAKYRLSVTPGSYRVTGWWGSRLVIVRARHTVSTDFWNVCI